MNTLYEYEGGAAFNFTLTNTDFIFTGSCINEAFVCGTATPCTPILPVT